jgi:hypothetical protein
MAQVRTYDPKKVIITIGSHTVTGYGEDTFIGIEPEGDGTTAVAGADGEVARALNHNPLHTVTITVLQTSPTNDYLSRLLERDRASGGGGVVPFQIRDLRGSTLIAGSQAWVTNTPSVEFGNSVGEREWTLMVVVNAINVGGNL